MKIWISSIKVPYNPASKAPFSRGLFTIFVLKYKETVKERTKQARLWAPGPAFIPLPVMGITAKERIRNPKISGGKQNRLFFFENLIMFFIIILNNLNILIL